MEPPGSPSPSLSPLPPHLNAPWSEARKQSNEGAVVDLRFDDGLFFFFVPSQLTVVTRDDHRAAAEGHAARHSVAGPLA